MPSSKFGKTPPKGVYTPLCTFFHPDQSLDLESFKKHVQNVGRAGVIAAARQALDADPACANVPLIAGTGAGSTVETIELTKEAAEAGADFAMVIAPGYFVKALSREALKQFFIEVAEASPIPILVYNFPGASAGVDLDSDLIAEVTTASSNIAGTKLTCGNVGKIARLTGLPDFAVYGGFIDFLQPSLTIGAAGCITGLGNIAPKTCLKLYHDSIASLSGSGDPAATAKLQAIVSHADWALQKGSVAGTKWVLERLHGFGSEPRRPLLPFDASSGKGEQLLKDLEEILTIERTL
ncbi:hypothetical protein Rhopal_002156-T1 [Rhodotorula paludigena]|uniref:Dihydrodipicolinate synthase n=1 Tax=Rhodotorula paludigena TaxID=86838 RepID=A0AAV5GJF1_9BASI|nr:hypothetical protein Rhopal_002156-T1 [Rhodotorula paludigena]